MKHGFNKVPMLKRNA